MKKNIILFIGNNPHQIYFVNRIIEEGFNVKGIFIQGRGSIKNRYKRIKRKSKSLLKLPYFFLKNRLIRILINRTLYPYSKVYKKEIYNKLFNGKWQEIKLSENKIFYKKSFRFKNWIDEIKSINPDIILVHGGGIVPNKIISLANDYALNLHWGYSPFYRGSYCIPWCVYNDELDKIAVTIHDLTDIIDGGAIYKIEKPLIKKDDNIFTLEMKLTCLGTDIIINFLKRVENNEKIVFRSQNLSLGTFYRAKDFMPSHAKKVMKEIKNGIFRDQHKK
ncbi:MAG: formyltransferase family protein [Promethearchaeota archaeon]